MKRERDVKLEEPPRKRRKSPPPEDIDDEKQPEVAEQIELVLSDDEDSEETALKQSLNTEENLQVDKGLLANYGPCAVKKIRMQNFHGMTDLTIKPGPGTNFITGPNGSGKTTTHLALYAVTGGKPDKILSKMTYDDWITAGENEARVKVCFAKPRKIRMNNRDLFKMDGPFTVSLVLKRGLPPSEDGVRWFLSWVGKNGKHQWRKHGPKQIQTFFQNLNIRCDNPCQFLHQEKVGEFSALRPKDRFEETLRTHKDGTLAKQHNKLVGHYKKFLQYEKELENAEAILGRLKAQKKQLERSLQHSRKWKGILQKKDALFAMNSVLKYRELKMDSEELQTLLEGYSDMVKDLQEKKVPYDTAVEEASAGLKTRNESLKKFRTAISRSRDLKKNAEESLKKAKKTLMDEREKLKDYEKRLAENISQIAEVRISIEQLEEEKKTYKDNSAEIEKKNKEIEVKLLPLRRARRELEKKLTKNGQEKVTVRIAIDAKNGKVEEAKYKMKNIKSKFMPEVKIREFHLKIESLKEQNTVFRGEVYGPLGVFIKVKNAKFGTPVQDMLGSKLTRGFLVSNSEDAKMIRKLMDTHNVHKINVYTQPGDTRLKYGGDANWIRSQGGRYLIDEIEAPGLVKDHLVACGFASVAVFPDGTDCYNFLKLDNTARNATENRKRLSKAYTSKKRFAVIMSAYTTDASYVESILDTSRNPFSAKEQSMAEINKLNGAISKLREKLGLLNGQEAQLQEQLDAKLAEIAKFQKRKISLNARPEVLQNQKKGTIERLQRENLPRKIEMCKSNILRACSRMRASMKNLKTECLNKMRRDYMKKRFLFVKKADTIRLEAAEKSRSRFLKDINNNTRRKNAENRAYKNCLEKLEETKNACRSHSSRFKRLWNELNVQEKYMCTNGEDSKEKIKHDQEKLDADIAVLERQLDEYLDDRESLERAENDYERWEGKLKLQTSRRDQAQERVDDNIRMRKTIEAVWLPECRKLVSSINESFKKMTKLFGAQGEVTLSEDPKGNYSNFAINVNMSSLQKGELLRSVSAGSHSGGEQSVATMIYILALQNVSELPFRCVDEINQGMDDKNERKIMSLVGTLCHQAHKEGRHPPQMFIFSPNLLRNMNWDKYKAVMRFHVIMNGPHNAIGADWDREKVVEEQIRHSQQISQMMSQFENSLD